MANTDDATTTSDGDPLNIRDQFHRDALAAGFVPPEAPSVMADSPPEGFPPDIPVDQITFSDWSLRINVAGVYIARIATAQDAVTVCNWAAANGWAVRPSGANHNWSPFLLAPGTAASPPVIFVDTSKLTGTSFEYDGNPLATFGTGLTLEAASAYLAGLDNGGLSAAPGYAFPQLPAPGNLTLGGALAIGAHGTVVPTKGGSSPYLMGCLSNLITGFEAVVTDPTKTGQTTYELRTFQRTDVDAAAFLVHLGRTFVTSVTMLVEPNYYLQLTCLFPQVSDLLGAPSQDSPGQFSALLDEYGRIEILWFPFNDQAFVQANQRQETAIEPQVAGPYNFPWMNSVTPDLNAAIAHQLKTTPSDTPAFTKGELGMAASKENGKVYNGISRDLEIYLKDTTLRVTLWGWAIQIPRSQVQYVANEFYEQVQSQLSAAESKGEYPVNAAMEIRCTTVDSLDGLPWDDAVPAPLAATNPVDPSLDTVIWLNVGTITGTPGANEFFTELEAWLLTTFESWTLTGRVRPEWSKAWAYTDAGPWTNPDTIQTIRAAFPASDPPFDFAWVQGRLAAYDQGNIFRSPLLEQLFELPGAEIP